MSIDEPPPLQATPSLSSSTRPPPFNQCVFVRGFQMGDRSTWLRRKTTRIDENSGFKVVRKPLDLKTKERDNTTTHEGSQQHLSSSGGGQSSRSDTSRAAAKVTPFGGQQSPQLGEYSGSDEEAEMVSLNFDEVEYSICDDIVVLSLTL